ncbi:hypothetical protein BDW22DRAFT_1431206 [Trametopsis cervina]|nr:hypothetical protein BDW22DRAFT_1431206 [Trametopsis cervina]
MAALARSPKGTGGTRSSKDSGSRRNTSAPGSHRRLGATSDPLRWTVAKRLTSDGSILRERKRELDVPAVLRLEISRLLHRLAHTRQAAGGYGYARNGLASPLGAGLDSGKVSTRDRRQSDDLDLAVVVHYTGTPEPVRSRPSPRLDLLRVTTGSTRSRRACADTLCAVPIVPIVVVCDRIGPRYTHHLRQSDVSGPTRYAAKILPHIRATRERL